MEKMKNNIKVAELKQELEEKNRIIDDKIKNELYNIPFKLRECVFFNGEWAQKIDNFPNDPEIEALYEDSMLNLEYLYNQMLLSFLNFAFGGEHHSTYLASSSDYVNTISEAALGMNLNQSSGFIFDGDKYHLVGDQTYETIFAVDWFFFSKTESDCARESISYKRFARIRDFDVPDILKPFVEFNGREFVKKEHFPKILNKKYDTYIQTLKTLLFIYQRDFWKTMFGFCWTSQPVRRRKKK